jgi:hypothetical protein
MPKAAAAVNGQPARFLLEDDWHYPRAMDEVGRFDATKGPRIVGPRDGASVDLGAISARFMVWGEESGGGLSLVEHPIPPRTLAAPIHRHSREDEYSPDRGRPRPRA